MRKLLTLLAFSMLLVAPRAFAQAQSSQFDPCAVFPKQMAAINIATATTTQLVALQATSPIQVCGLVLNQVNGTGSLALEYGTGTTCGTGTTALTGTIFAATTASGTTNTVRVGVRDKGSMATVPMGNALCALTTGTIQQSGWVTYVQQPNVNAANFSDPCMGNYPQSVAPINFSAATEATLVTGVANTTMYVCEIYYQDAGRATTANTGQFTYGTKVSTACDTGATNLGGPISGGLVAGANATTLVIAGTATNFTVPSGNSLCLTPTQSSTLEGYVTYVQR